MFDHLQRLSIDFYIRKQASDVLARFSSDLAAVETAMAAALSWALLSGLDVLSATVLLFVLDWRLTLVAQLVWPVTLAGA